MNQVADFNRIVTPIYDKITKVQVLNVRLAETRDTLLPKLMSGELNVDATSNQILPQVVEDLKRTVVSSKNRSQIDFSANVSTNDKILTLSTCNNDAGTERLVIHAKLIKKENR